MSKAKRLRTPAKYRRVLIVDDNADIRCSVAELLGYSDHEVETAASGAEALQVAATFNPHTVLIDIGLPDIDGYEVARRLRREEGGQSRVLIAVSGYGTADDIRKSQDAGFDHHVLKPVHPDLLEKLIQQ
jgi:two-component system CheB/CheR fusion protein